MEPRRVAFWYALTLSVGLSVAYGSITGVFSFWFLPLATFLLVGWVFSLLFVLWRILRRKRPSDPRQ